MRGTVIADPAPLTLERNTADFGFNLTQKFTRDTTEQEAVIEMTLLNLAAVSRTHVILKRIADLDIDSTPANDEWDRTLFSIIAKDPGVAIALTALPVTFPTTSPNFTQITGLGDPCSGATVSGPVTGDYVGHVGFSIGTMLPGSSVTVKLRYGKH